MLMTPEAVREVARSVGPFTSVSFDAGRTGESAAGEISARFRALAEDLAARGAPQADVAALHEVSTALPGRGGPLTRLSVARDGEVVLDLVLPGAPPRDECTFGPAPHLMPVSRALRLPTPALVVEVDRAGATIEVLDQLDSAAEIEQVEGSHELLHKVPAGGWSHRRMQARVQDSWDRNAAEVAAAVDRIVADLVPVVVLVAGDPYAVGALTRALGGAAAELVVHLDSGGRAAGVHQAARDAAITAALRGVEHQRRQAMLERFSGALARQQEAVQGLDSVVDAVRRGQVQDVLLRDDPTSTETLWSGPEPLQIGVDRADLAAIGVDAPVRMRADAVLLRAVFASGADVLLLGDEDDPPTDGIGALLRWSDPATAHDAAPAMPGHGQAPGSRPG
jgi:hypothetical protein